MINTKLLALAGAALLALPLAALPQSSEQLVERYTTLAGSKQNATSLVTGLRDGKEVKLTSANTTETFTPPTGKMGYGNVDNALALAAASLKDKGITQPTPAQLEASLMDILKMRADGIDLTGKLKLATADEDKGLGTGEHDAIFLVDLYRTFDRLTGFGGVGYHMLGDSPAVPLDNVWSATLGASYKLDERDSAGLILEGRQRVSAGASPQRELVGFFMRKLDSAWKAQAYALIGLADGSPDWGAGLSLARPF